MLSDKQLEKAARNLCELRGINPDEMYPHGAEPDANGFVPAICLYSPAWKLLAKEVRQHEQIAGAISKVENN